LIAPGCVRNGGHAVHVGMNGLPHATDGRSARDPGGRIVRRLLRQIAE